MLLSSKVVNVPAVPSYLLVCKRLENIGDNINHLSIYLKKSKADVSGLKGAFDQILAELDKGIRFLLGNAKGVFQKTEEGKIKSLRKHISQVRDRAVHDYMEDTLRFLINIEEELVNISFFSQLARENLV